MITQQQAETILGQLQSASVDTRLKAINAAKDLQKQLFTPEMNDAEWSYSALTVQMLYNMICDELRQAQPRVIRHEVSGTTKVEKIPKPKKEKKPQMDITSLMAAFAEFKANKK